MTKNYYRQVNGAMVVFDLSNKLTYKSCKSWLEELKSHSDTVTNIILVGNKSDLDEDREVDLYEVEDFARQQGIPFILTSAFTDTNVQEAFDRVINDVFQTGKRKKFKKMGIGESDFEADSIKLGQTKTEEKGGCCIFS